jgi:hypothetical protein
MSLFSFLENRMINGIRDRDRWNEIEDYIGRIYALNQINVNRVLSM